MVTFQHIARNTRRDPRDQEQRFRASGEGLSSRAGGGAGVYDLAARGADLQGAAEEGVVADQGYYGVGDFFGLDYFRGHPALDAVLLCELEASPHHRGVDDSGADAVDADFALGFPTGE